MQHPSRDELLNLQSVTAIFFVFGPCSYLYLAVVLPTEQPDLQLLRLHSPYHLILAFPLALACVFLGLRLMDRKRVEKDREWRVYLNNFIRVMACFQAPGLICLVLGLTGADFWSITILGLASPILAITVFPTHRRFEAWVRRQQQRVIDDAF